MESGELNQSLLRSRAALVSIALAASALVVQAQVFSAPKNLSNNGTAEFGQIAVDPSGNINVVWDESGNFDIFFSRSTDGGVTFSTPKNLSNNAGSSVFPQIAVDSSGNINVVWEDSTPGNFNIFFCRSNNGGVTFSAPKNLSNMAGVSAGAQIAVDSGGNVNVVWDNFNATNSDIFFSRSTDGGVSFSVPKNVSNNTGASVFPGVDAATNRGNIAVDSSGNINVVWDDFTPGNSQIFFSRSTDGSATFSTPKNLSNNAASSGSSQIAVDSAGNINVAWGNFNGTNSDIFFSRSTDGGVSFSVPKNLSNNGFSASSRIAADSGGNINVVWENTGTNSDIFFSRSINGVTFSTPKNLSSDASFSGDAQIAVDPSGNINVVWGNLTSGGIAGSAVLFAGSTDGGVSFSTPKILSNNAFQPQIAVGPSGNINVIWDNITFPPISSDIFYSGSVSPTIASVSPSSGLQGQNITDFTVTGTDFDPSAVLSFSRTGIVVNSYSSRIATQIVASITIAANAGIGPRDVVVTNPGVQQATLSGGFTVLQGAAILPDLSITSIEPVQVVFDADINGDGETDLVLGKPTVALVTVHVENAGALRTSVNVDLQFQGTTYTSAFQSSDLDSSGNVQLNFSVLPSQLGVHQPMIATVDPSNVIAESDEGNNTSQPIFVSIKQTNPLRVVYVPLIETADNSFIQHVVETRIKAAEFVLGTFPIADSQLLTVQTGSITGIPIGITCVSTTCPVTLAQQLSLALNATSVWDDLINLASVGFFHNADRTVGIVPRDYFSKHGLCGFAGFTKDKMSTTVLATVDYWTAVAHELGHTYKLPIVGAEEYSQCPPVSNGNLASRGYWVKNNQLIAPESRVCFMGTASPASASFDPRSTRWIERPDYEYIFRQVATIPNDPGAILITGILDKENNLELRKWSFASSSNVDPEEAGDLFLTMLDINHTVLKLVTLPVSFNILLEGIGNVDAPTTILAQRVSLPPGVVTFQFNRAGISLGNIDVVTKLLRDALDSVPDTGFLFPAQGRRTALTNMIDAIDRAIRAHNAYGAMQMLSINFRTAIGNWLLNDYPTTETQLSKQQVLVLTDAMVNQLRTP